jgi:hypothetical protein
VDQAFVIDGRERPLIHLLLLANYVNGSVLGVRRLALLGLVVVFSASRAETTIFVYLYRIHNRSCSLISVRLSGYTYF